MSLNMSSPNHDFSTRTPWETKKFSGMNYQKFAKVRGIICKKHYGLECEGNRERGFTL